MINNMGMKHIIQYSILALAIATAMWSCSNDEAQPVQYKAPEVNFTMASDNIAAQVGESVPFSASVVFAGIATPTLGLLLNCVSAPPSTVSIVSPAAVSAGRMKRRFSKLSILPTVSPLFSTDSVLFPAPVLPP